MIRSAFFVFRIALAWFLAYQCAVLFLAETLFRHIGLDEGVLFGLGAIIIGYIALGAIAHLRRVRLIAGEVNDATLSNRQRRQIEVPFEAGEAFDMIDAAIRELPGSVAIESARDSLQVRARIRRVAPYSSGGELTLWLTRLADGRRNQILATVTPNGEAGSVTLICEPCSPGWSDWFLVDDGSNLENAEAIGRAHIFTMEKFRADLNLGDTDDASGDGDAQG